MGSMEEGQGICQAPRTDALEGAAIIRAGIKSIAEVRARYLPRSYFQLRRAQVLPNLKNRRQYESPRTIATPDSGNQTRVKVMTSYIRVIVDGNLKISRNHYGKIASRKILARQEITARYRHKIPGVNPKRVQILAVKVDAPIHHDGPI